MTALRLGVMLLALLAGCSRSPRAGTTLPPDAGSTRGGEARPSGADATPPRRAGCDPARCGTPEPCRRAVCDDQGRCQTVPVAGLCNDGDPCTHGDHCQAGACVGTPYACDPACLLCDGAGGCALQPGHCRIDGGCLDDAARAPSDPCRMCAAAANPTAWSNAPAGTPCEDGDPCSVSDLCLQGLCSPGQAKPCDDKNPCTLDRCQAPLGCEHLPTGGLCTDGDPCTVGDHCAEGQCTALGPLLCDDAEPCTADVCDPEVGCVFSPIEAPCDDGDPCTSGDSCQSGACAPGAPALCDDADACTLDTCSPDLGCQHAPGPPCPQDGNPCTVAACDPATGACVPSPIVADCNDGDLCTDFDTCVDGACQGLATNCDDGLVCTTDTCDPALGCQHVATCCGSVGTNCPPEFECTPMGTCEAGGEVFVPAGPFWMGWSGGAATFSNNLPDHAVIVSAFAIDRTEVTAGAYAECVAAGVCDEPAPQGLPWDTLPKLSYVATYGDPALVDHPITRVTWFQAVTYCQWAGKRLPTEAEWAKAARGGCETTAGDCQEAARPYPWGDAWPTCELAVIDTAEFPGTGCGASSSWPVGSKPAGASPYGALDMVGNVSEWVHDRYAGDYYCMGPNTACDPLAISDCECAELVPPFADPWVDPQGPPVGDTRVMRGSAYFETGSARHFIFNRGGTWPDWPAGGFRCARSLDL